MGNKSEELTDEPWSSGRADDIEDLEVSMKVGRGAKFDWDSYCDGEAYWVFIPESARRNVAGSFRHAAEVRGRIGRTRWREEFERQIKGETWGRLYVQAKAVRAA